MSLTSELEHRHTPVREWFEEHLPNLSPIQQAWRAAGPPTVVTDLKRGLGQIGSAIDYRIRFWYERPVVKRLAAAAAGADRLPPPGAAVAFDAITADLEAFLHKHDAVGRLLDDSDERQLAWYCYVLALYEVPYRQPRAPTPLLELPAAPSPDDLKILVPQPAIDDLHALAKAFATDLGSAPPPAERIMNPRFAGSRLVGDADGDLILDRCLIDIKTTVKRRPERKDCYQLIGYAILDTTDAYGLTSVGFYLPRVPRLITWPLADLINEMAERPVDIADLRSEFVRFRQSRRLTPTGPREEHDLGEDTDLPGFLGWTPGGTPIQDC